MNETTALIQVTPTTVQTILSIAPTVAASRMFSVTQEQAAVVMLKGYELGFGLATAFEFIHVIDGKPGISPKGMMAMIQRSNDVDVRPERLVDTKGNFFGYKCYMKRRSSGIEHTASFTLEDAKRAGLDKPNSGWQKYPENMCMWRAIGFAADVVCPDLGGGMHRVEELGAIVNVEGEPVITPIIDIITTVQPTIAESQAIDAPWTLQALVTKFGADAVMAANEGRIPGTDAEIAAIAEKLAANA